VRIGIRQVGQHMIDFGLRGCHGPLPRAGKGACTGRPVPAHIGSSVHIFASAAGVSRRTDLPQHNTPGGPGRGGYGPSWEAGNKSIAG